MNKLETAYAAELARMVSQGEIASFEFEGVSFRLARGAWFTPDFAVWHYDGRLELHETKGFWREAARVRIKVAASKYDRCRFVAIRLVKGAWVREEFRP